MITGLFFKIEVAADGANSKINVQCKFNNFSVINTGDFSLIAKLHTPSGILERQLHIDLKNYPAIKDTGFVFAIDHPVLWTAETPDLYSLKLYLYHNTDTIQYFDQKIGIREISIDGKVLKINGEAIKLRGVNLHEIDPFVGRALTRVHRLKILDQMKRANINFVRTSHYPPHHELIELCDSIGLYVMCEVPFGFGDEWLDDTSYQDILLTRANATVTRDKNNPSVIIWSIGNENPFTEITGETGKYVKKMDPTRPICYPQIGGYFESLNYDLPEYVDIFAPHYPNVSRLEKIAQESQRPVIITEYAHALGLAFEGQRELWEIIEANDVLAGGSIWLWSDQGILRKGNIPGAFSSTTENWITDTSYFDMAGDQGSDGILYADGKPQTDFREVRNNYSQVIVKEESISIKQGLQDVFFEIENRFDFLDLKSKIEGFWYLTENNDTIQSGHFVPTCAPNKKTNFKLSLNIPNPPKEKIYLLELCFFDVTGRALHEHVIRLKPEGRAPKISSILNGASFENKPVFQDIDNKTILQIKNAELSFDNITGDMVLKETLDYRNLIAGGPYLKIGRSLTMSEKRMVSGNCPEKYLLSGKLTDRDFDKHSSQFNYLYRLNPDDDYFVSKLTGIANDSGWISIDYSIIPKTEMDFYLLEGGISFLLDTSITEFRWLGKGPFVSYPGKESLNNYGFFHKTYKDIDFTGNHGQIDLAIFTDKKGNGFAILCDSGNIGIEKTDLGLLMSFNSHISGKGTKFSVSSTIKKISAFSELKGQFQIIPLQGNNWPSFFLEAFGDPEKQIEFNKPFLLGYDMDISKFRDIKVDPNICKIKVTASGFEPPNFPHNVTDNDLHTRWSSFGTGAWLQIKLCESTTLNSIDIAFQNGNSRITTFDILTSKNGKKWKKVLSNAKSSGSTFQPEKFNFKKTKARYIKYIGYGNNFNEWSSITEIGFDHSKK